MRTCVICVWWLVMVALLLPRPNPDFGKPMFSFFRITVVLAIIWLLVEGAEAGQGRASTRAVILDALLALPMFSFWLAVMLSTG